MQEQIRSEGITFKLPFVTSITRVSIKQETKEGDAPCFSSDLQTVHVKYNILYRIPKNKVCTLFQQYQGDPYESLILPRVQESIKQVTALHKAEDLVKNRETIKKAALEKLQAVLTTNEDPLLIVNDLVINNIDLTAQLEKAIEEKQVMEQSALTKTYELQKERTEAEITVVRATAEAQSVKIKGDALKSSPEVIQLEIAKKWNGICPLSVSTTAGGANILLPLK
jgi:prohibitin 2